MAVYRVTVEDVETGVSETAEVHSGDYLLLTFEPCRLHHTQTYSMSDSVSITLHNHRPQGPQRRITEGQ
jgi:hypothetical protein